MADLFGARGPGTVVRLTGGKAVSTGAISIEGETWPLVITGVGLSASTNVQFALSLKDTVYVYVLGDRMGAITINGMVFDTGCDGEQAEGLRGIMAKYEEQKASQKTTPSKIQIGGHATHAYLMSVEGRGDNSMPGIYNVTLSFAALAGGHYS